MNIIEKDKIKENTCYVYVADYGTGVLKIGTSKDVKNRVLNIGKSYYKPLKDYFLIEGSYDLEALIHKLFKSHWVYSEWFDVSYEDAKTIIKAKEVKIEIEEKEEIVKNASLEISRKELESYLDRKFFEISRIENSLIVLIEYDCKDVFNKINNKDLEFLITDYVESQKELFGEDSDEYIDSFKDMQNVKSIREFYFTVYDYNFYINDTMVWSYLSGVITLLDYIKSIKKYLDEFIRDSEDYKDTFLCVKFCDVETLRDEIADIIEVSSELVNEKELYQKIKEFVTK